ncbi:MAG: Ppx/GppA family phosphatase [Rhodobacteraceae bacterium]|nr:MAG: Ppx/GppA family phosphatase [Paracoccaceae bacterium]
MTREAAPPPQPLPVRPVGAQRRATAPRQPLLGALDLGTNNCRLLIAAPRPDGFHVVDSFSRAVHLGEGVEQSGALSDAAMARTLDALWVCADKLRRHGVRRMRAVATEACRRAANGRAFLDRVRAATGLRLDLITAEEEARLAVAGCAPLLDEDAEELLVIDIGGGSTELIWIDLSGTPPHLRPRLLMALAPARRGVLEADARARAAAAHIVDWVSAPLGVATLHDRFCAIASPRERFEAMTACFEEQLVRFIPYARRAEGGRGRLQIIGASGTVTTIAGAHLGLRRYDRSRVDGSWLPYDGATRVIEEMLALDDETRLHHPHIGADRALLIVAGAAILATVMRLWPAERLRVADRGLREGLLYALIGEGTPKP